MTRVTEEVYPKLAKFQGPISEALAAYSAMSAGKLEFDPGKAQALLPTRHHRYTAFSMSPVTHIDKVIGHLRIAVLGPLEGTGNSAIHSRLNDENPDHGGLDIGSLPKDSRVLPRPIDGIAYEGFFPISSHRIGDFDADPIAAASPDASMYAANVSQLGVRHGLVGKVATLGQGSEDFKTIVNNGVNTEPTVTLIVGHDKRTAEPFGEPHAEYNPHSDAVQVFGLLAIREDIGGLHIGALEDMPTQRSLPIAA
ncbi:MAG TPA: hypothetical protein VD947_01555 [Patescibacteria group bacterium]|nr:hypothetical protein [Patescibacteria group bacterium]